MKKLNLFLITIFLLCAILTSCVLTPSEGTQKIKESNPSTITENNSDSLEPNSNPNNETPSSSNNEKLVIEETVLHDEGGIKITVKGVEESIFGTNLKFFIENNTDRDIYIQTEYVIVNNYMMNSLFSADIPAGKKTNENMMLVGLEEAGITKIGLIETCMFAGDSSTYDHIVDFGHAEIKTNLFGKMDGKSDNGKVLMEWDGIKVVAQYINNDSIWGKELFLYTENNYEKDVIISIEDFSVNDFSMTAIGTWTVNSGKKSVKAVTIFESELEKNEIKKVEKIEFKIEISDPNTYRTLFESDPLVCIPE